METVRGAARELVSGIRVIVDRSLAVQPLPSPTLTLLIGVLAVVLVVATPLWPATRLLITVTHEGGHAVAAVLTGRRLQGVRLHRDTSGLTVSRGRPRGPGMVITLLAGYLGPAVVGVLAALLLAAGHSLGVLWGLLVVLVWMLLQIRNGYGLPVLLTVGTGLALVSWFLPATVQSAIAYLITWTLLLAAPKPVLELARQRREGRARGSDVDQLARLTPIPAGAWIGLLFVLSCAGLVVGAATLLPELAGSVLAAFGPG